MKNSKKELELGSVSFITKLAGFEHTEYIKPNATKIKINSDDVPMYIGMNIKNGRLTNEISWFLPKKISMQLHRSALTKKCIVLPYVGSVGDVAVFDSEERHHLASNVAKIELTNDAPFSPEYLYYFLKSPFGQRKLLFYIQGGVQKNITMDAIRKTIIPIQDNANKIVQILSDLDSKIELNNRINAELEAMAKTLYDYWFVQFDFPDKNGKPYKTSGGKMVWNEELKREIPEGWEDDELKDIANITMGQSPPGESYNEVKNGMIFYQGCTDFGNRFPSIRQFTTEPTRFAKEGDILLSVRAPVGTLNISKEVCCIGRGLAALNSKDNCIAYLFGVMVNLKQIFDRRNVDGTTFGSITKDDLFSLKVIKPEKSILKQYHSIINPAFEKQNKLELENIKLTELRDWLLPMLMNGQVKVN
jgi:type I restriction enzyme, S subunit